MQFWFQKVELKATKVVHLGACDNSAGNYPVAKKKQTLEYLREKAHLRARTNTIGAVARIRNALAFATHEFFQSHGFLYVHTPLITTSDCEGAGEMFQVRSITPFFPCRIPYTLFFALYTTCRFGAFVWVHLPFIIISNCEGWIKIMSASQPRIPRPNQKKSNGGL